MPAIGTRPIALPASFPVRVSSSSRDRVIASSKKHSKKSPKPIQQYSLGVCHFQFYVMAQHRRELLWLQLAVVGPSRFICAVAGDVIDTVISIQAGEVLLRHWPRGVAGVWLGRPRSNLHR